MEPSAEAPGKGESMQEVLERELDGLYQLSGVLSVMLVRRDGVPLATIPAGKPGVNRLSSMLAAVRGTAEIATDEITGGRFLEALLRSETSEVFCVSVGEDFVLGVLAEKGALTGLLFMAVGSTAERLVGVLASQVTPPPPGGP